MTDRAKMACELCRKHRTKCVVLHDGSGKCERCTEKSVPCIYSPLTDQQRDALTRGRHPSYTGPQYDSSDDDSALSEPGDDRELTPATAKGDSMGPSELQGDKSLTSPTTKADTSVPYDLRENKGPTPRTPKTQPTFSLESPTDEGPPPLNAHGRELPAWMRVLNTDTNPHHKSAVRSFWNNEVQMPEIPCAYCVKMGRECFISPTTARCVSCIASTRKVDDCGVKYIKSNEDEPKDVFLAERHDPSPVEPKVMSPVKPKATENDLPSPATRSSFTAVNKQIPEDTTFTHTATAQLLAEAEPQSEESKRATSKVVEIIKSNAEEAPKPAPLSSPFGKLTPSRQLVQASELTSPQNAQASTTATPQPDPARTEEGASSRDTNNYYSSIPPSISWSQNELHDPTKPGPNPDFSGQMSLPSSARKSPQVRTAAEAGMTAPNTEHKKARTSRISSRPRSGPKTLARAINISGSQIERSMTVPHQHSTPPLSAPPSRSASVQLQNEQGVQPPVASHKIETPYNLPNQQNATPPFYGHRPEQFIPQGTAPPFPGNKPDIPPNFPSQQVAAVPPSGNMAQILPPFDRTQHGRDSPSVQPPPAQQPSMQPSLPTSVTLLPHRIHHTQLQVFLQGKPGFRIKRLRDCMDAPSFLNTVLSPWQLRWEDVAMTATFTWKSPYDDTRVMIIEHDDIELYRSWMVKEVFEAPLWAPQKEDQDCVVEIRIMQNKG